NNMKDYHINIFYSDEDGGYIADIPDLSGCSAFGETAEQALKEVEKAKALWLEVSKKKKQKAPIPHYKPFIYQTHNSHV
ncbi:MAG: type II toxin-antitoxin system HicB family antitoxin, partial [Rickettsiales bacterium]